LAVMAKEFTQLTRDRLTWAMILVLPIMQMLMFGYAINTEPRNLPTAVLVQDDSVFARSFLASVDNSGFFRITRQVRTPQELDQLISSGEVLFAITVPGDFTRRVMRGDEAQILLEVDATDPMATGGAVGAISALPVRALAH